MYKHFLTLSLCIVVFYLKSYEDLKILSSWKKREKYTSSREELARPHSIPLRVIFRHIVTENHRTFTTKSLWMSKVYRVRFGTCSSRLVQTPHSTRHYALPTRSSRLLFRLLHTLGTQAVASPCHRWYNTYTRPGPVHKLRTFVRVIVVWSRLMRVGRWYTQTRDAIIEHGSFVNASDAYRLFIPIGELCFRRKTRKPPKHTLQSIRHFSDIHFKQHIIMCTIVKFLI